jgi:uncharacterized membrane protein
MNFNPLLEASAAIQIHVAAVAVAVGLSVFMVARPKGTPAHRLAGRGWAAMLATICVSSFWITGTNPGHYTWIHLLSAGTLVGLVYAVWQVRRGNVRAHKYAMLSIMFGALAGAGAFTLLPGRLMGQVFFG